MPDTVVGSDEPLDPRRLRHALTAIEAALNDHTVVGVSLLDAAQHWVAATLEQRTEGALWGLEAYVKANWSTFVAAHGGVPLLDFLVTSHLQHEVWAVISAQDADLMRDHQRSHAAVEALFRLCRSADRSTLDAERSIERDLHNMRIDEREQVWLNGGEWD